VDNKVVGKEILHYRIIEKLGEGGMGVVFKAIDNKLKRQVAIKFLPNHIAKNSDERKRFEIEAQAAASLNHPNISTIYSIETSDDQVFIVMEYIEGVELKDKIKSGPIPTDEAISNAIQIAEGIDAACKKGIVHRDIKSKNIMITSEGKVKIMDFGLAKIRGGTQVTKFGTTVGTAAYMSPEQARGEEVDHRTDIWSFGVVLYEMLRGKLPFKGDYEQAVIYSIINESPAPVTAVRTSVPMELERITNKLLAKNINERYQNMTDVLVDLQTLRNKSTTSDVSSITKNIIQRKRKLPLKWITASAVLVITILSFLILKPWESSTHQIRSLAVLPLSNFSHAPDQEYFVDGMTEALIAELSKIQSLTVISRTSVMQFKGTKKTLPEIAKELNVDAIIEGSALLLDDKVRITAQLVDAFDKHRWAKSYDRNLKDVFTIHHEVALTIAREVQKNITSQDKSLSPNHYPKNSEVYQLYLKGRYFFNLYTYDSHKKAIQYFEQVIKLDPDFALGYAGLADVYGIWSALELPRKVAIAKSKDYVMKALNLDESMAEAHTTLGYIKMNYDWDWQGAEKELRRAIELNPNYAFAYHILSHYLLIMGQNDESLEVSKRALELSPLDLEMNGHLGFHYYWTREYDKAIEQYTKTLEIDPDYPWPHSYLGRAYKEMGWYSKSIEKFKQALSLMGKNEPEILSNLGNVYAISGNRKKALEIINELLEQSKQKYVPSQYIADVYVGLGEKDKAFEWLEKAFQERQLEPLSPFLDPIREDPRFTDLMHRMNLHLKKDYY
jgi:serine/threonine protein kinase/Tfp pilus assembly protein PilF